MRNVAKLNGRCFVEFRWVDMMNRSKVWRNYLYSLAPVKAQEPVFAIQTILCTPGGRAIQWRMPTQIRTGQPHKLFVVPDVSFKFKKCFIDHHPTSEGETRQLPPLLPSWKI
jgi:hypothetical protein